MPIVRGQLRRNGLGPLLPSRSGEGHMSDGSINQVLTRWQVAADVARFQARDLRRIRTSRAGEVCVDRFTRNLIQQRAQAPPAPEMLPP